jgi:hypothetical protein
MSSLSDNLATSIFTPRDERALRDALGFATYAELAPVLLRIGRATLQAWGYNHRRKNKHGDTELAKRKLVAIGAAARKLAQMIKEDEDTALLVCEPDDYPSPGNPRTEHADWHAWLEASRQDMLAKLNRIDERAAEWIENRDQLRYWAGLTPNGKAGESAIHSLLWPTLFKVWEEAGRPVSFSPGGPLLKFFALVHRAGRLPPPSENTLKSAARNWRGLKSPPDLRIE